MFNRRLCTWLWKMIPLLNVGLNTVPDYSLGERDADVLSVINSEDLTAFTFDGLKRRLGLHPETLSRILARLEQEGFLKKEPNGYKVSPKITKLKLHEAKEEENHVPLLQTYLPSNVQVQHLIVNLNGKWFGSLRWFGLAETSRGITLKWVTEDGGMQINANIQDSALTIEAKFLRDNNLNRALSASYQLISYIGTVLKSRHHVASHVGLFGGSDVFLMPA
jgi:DNA-binding MarR family transcriptional regulator